MHKIKINIFQTLNTVYNQFMCVGICVYILFFNEFYLLVLAILYNYNLYFILKY